MLKSTSHRSRLGLLNRRHGAVTVIEAPVAHSYLRRGKVAFFVVTCVVGLLAATVASHYTHPIVGGLLGLLIGVLLGAVVGAFIAVWPVLRVLWHWAPEISLSLAVVYGWTWLMSATNLVVSLLTVALLVGVPAGVRPLRRRIVAVAWCLIVRHRLRHCFAAIAATLHAALPLILTARPTPAGERVWVWLRPGLSIKDLEAEGQTQKLAVACWANEARVAREGRRFAALIRIDITRRTPLSATVNSPLPGIVPDQVPTTAPAAADASPAGLDLPEVPEPGTAPATGRTGRKPRNPQPQPAMSDNFDYA